MKKVLALVLTLCMVFALFGTAAYADEPVTISLWTYPIGGWGNSETVDALIAGFEAANPGIKVNVEYLAYADGDDKVNTAIEGKAAPDLIMEGPERLVANWGAKGYMVDIADLWDDADKAEILPVVQAACFNKEGASYEYPLCMTAHCMAVNLPRFQAVGADKYLDLDTHTWTTDGFIEAVKMLAAENPNVAAIYCSGQGGDQGTRAIINN
ncbi:MAG: extracellular solute-binding protein, partial [Oscillospiraceae bacterium]|nr:extracellular solute-binding protein [Oscillospiraceae bacterium]